MSMSAPGRNCESGSCASTVWMAAGINVLGMLLAGRLRAR